MANFMIHFLICNVFICGIIGILLIAKWIFKNNLSSRMQYNLWFLLLGLLAVPFLPFRLTGFPQVIPWIGIIGVSSASSAQTSIGQTIDATPDMNANWMNDFTLSINSKTPPIIGYILLGIWMVGILAMIISVIKSILRLHTLKKSALPLQNMEVRRLYHHCLEEIGISKDIPVYSTAFLKSPIIAGLLKPCIYLPIHLISDYMESDTRYILLHELQHYKHKDILSSYLMNLAGIIYWFNPLIWYSLKEMRNDREVACDTSVLKILEEDAYKDYGNTLINFAEKVSLSPFPFAASLGSNMKQMKRRIINIASYEKPTFMKRLTGITSFMLIAILLLVLAPFISIYATDETHYQWNFSSENVINTELSAYFGEYEGSFVLYDLKKATWSIYDMEHATLRVAPNSTYKIYNALFGLEEGVITPDNSLIPWNGETYPVETWNADQTLQSAMCSSVNWYFQAVDEHLGASSVYNYIQQIGYGNEKMNGNLATYWMESSLKISPVEQVELLIKLHNNSFGFSPENINAIENAICLFSSDTGIFYGKTGTGCVDGQDVNGWFIGYIETENNTYYFATNIGADKDATGNNATKITMSILSDMNIWK